MILYGFSLREWMTVVPSTRVVPVSADPKEPHKMIRIHGVLAAKDVNEEEKVFIASSASIVGDNISIAASSSVWYGALVRGTPNVFAHIVRYDLC